MTTFTLDGPIQEIITTSEIAIVSLVASGSLGASPTAIDPSGANRTIVIASVTGSGGAGPSFQMSSSFNIGDIVEIYNNTNPRTGFAVIDENGNDVSGSASDTPSSANALQCAVYRKLRSTAGRNWGFLPRP